MKQVSQNMRTGKTFVMDVPMISGGRSVVIAVAASAISSGTERYVVDLTRKNFFEKARARPDHVKRIIEKARTEGLRSTFNQVSAKLDEPMPLGYSAAGVVLDAGAAYRRFKPGDRVAVAGPHASVVAAGENLCARIPDSVSFEQAAYTGIATIALQGVRLAKVTLGERVLVIGTGLIGLMTIALLRAQGCRVFATDVSSQWLQMAETVGADATGLGSPADAVRAFSGGPGVDAVIITAATASNEPIEFAAAMCRQKGRIVLVGVAGLNIPRPPFFEKELEFTVSSSLGPGRNDPSYEGKSLDYPIGHVRWTMQRNMEAVLDQMAAGRLPVDQFTTHRVPIDDAPSAYEMLIRKTEPYLGIVLTYPDTIERRPIAEHRVLPGRVGTVSTSLIGAGNFGRLVLLPLLAKRDDVNLRTVCTATGLTASSVAQRYQFQLSTSKADQVLDDPQTDAVMILTRHHLHSDLAVRALRAGKNVFVEKPLCLTLDELRQINEAVAASPNQLLMVGFNRRFSKTVAELKKHFATVAPLSVSFRFSVPQIPESVWVQDPEVGGGRIIGEACHAIDTCIAITGSPVARVFAESVSPSGAVRTPDDRVFITLRHENGSVSNISYQAGGDSAAPKERIEVFGGGRTALVEDWDAIALWNGGKVVNCNGGKDKGHASELEAFFSACAKGGAWPISWAELESSAWAAISSVESLATGEPVDRDVLP